MVLLVERTWALEVESPEFKSWSCLFLFLNLYFFLVWLIWDWKEVMSESSQSRAWHLESGPHPLTAPALILPRTGWTGREERQAEERRSSEMPYWEFISDVRQSTISPSRFCWGTEASKSAVQGLSGSGVDLRVRVLYEELCLAARPVTGERCNDLPHRADAFHLCNHLFVCLWGLSSKIVQKSLVCLDNRLPVICWPAACSLANRAMLPP